MCVCVGRFLLLVIFEFALACPAFSTFPKSNLVFLGCTILLRVALRSADPAQQKGNRAIDSTYYGNT